MYPIHFHTLCVLSMPSPTVAATVTDIFPLSICVDLQVKRTIHYTMPFNDKRFDCRKKIYMHIYIYGKIEQIREKTNKYKDVRYGK